MSPVLLTKQTLSIGSGSTISLKNFLSLVHSLTIPFLSLVTSSYSGILKSTPFTVESCSLIFSVSI
jgi:hypothetical protein